MNTEQSIDAQIAALQTQKEILRSRRMWTCPCCSRRTAITKLIAVRQYWYEEPHGCTGGDNWWPSDDYHVWCNKCGEWIRVYKQHRVSEYDIADYKTRNQKEREKNPGFFFIEDHQNYFAEVHRNYSKTRGFNLNELRKQKQRREEDRCIY
jgi:hypothetical protein